MEKVKVIKVTNKDKTYTSKNGKEYPVENYYIQLENGVMIAIRPSFSKGYQSLDTIAEVIVNGNLD